MTESSNRIPCSVDSDTLLSEADVLCRWPALSKAGLRAARHQHRIAWVRGKRGSAWYRPSAIETFIKKELEQPCHDRAHARSLPSATSGLQKSRDQKVSIDSGLSQELAERAAKVSALKIFERRKPS